MEILRHHFDDIQRRFKGVTDIAEAESMVSTQEIPYLLSVRHPDGDLKYPLLNVPLVLKNLSRMIVAVNSGETTLIPEMDGRGSCNKDVMCEACGNLKLIDSRKKIYHCDLDRRNEQFITG